MNSFAICRGLKVVWPLLLSCSRKSHLWIGSHRVPLFMRRLGIPWRIPSTAQLSGSIWQHIWHTWHLNAPDLFLYLLKQQTTDIQFLVSTFYMFFFWMDHLLASLILHIASGLRLGSKAFKCASLFGAAPGIRAADGSSAPLWNRTRGWSPTVFWDPRGQWCHWSQGAKDWWWLITKTPCFVMSSRESLLYKARDFPEFRGSLY